MEEYALNVHKDTYTMQIQDLVLLKQYVELMKYFIMALVTVFRPIFVTRMEIVNLFKLARKIVFTLRAALHVSAIKAMSAKITTV